MGTLTPALKRDVLKSYGLDASDLRLNEQVFRITALRPGLGNLNIDPYVETVEWTDGTEDPTGDLNDYTILTGTLTLRKPTPDQGGAKLDLRDGHVIKCDVQWGGQWREVWRMRIWHPSISLPDGAWGFELSDDLRLLNASEDDFRYKRGKHKRRKGWLYHEIVRDVCRRYGVPVGQLVKGKRRIKTLIKHNTDPLDVIRAAVDLERSWTGRRLVITWRDGKLCVLPLTRSASLYELGPMLTQAAIETNRHGDFATSLTARATAKTGSKKKGYKRKKLVFKYTNPTARRQYGLIHRKVEFHGVDSKGELRDRTKRSLAKRVVVKPAITLTHPGIAFLRRGHAVYVHIPDEGLSGQAGIVFCQAITHRVVSGDYSMDLTLMTDDPLDPRELKKAADKAARLRVAAAKKAAKANT